MKVVIHITKRNILSFLGLVIILILVITAPTLGFTIIGIVIFYYLFKLGFKYIKPLKHFRKVLGHNDVKYLKTRIKELEVENKRLRASRSHYDDEIEVEKLNILKKKRFG